MPRECAKATRIPVERNLFKIGSSLAVTLPRVWTRHFRLQAGDHVEIFVNDDLVIKVKKKEEGAKRKEKFILDKL
jgi:antitoxin component of MazEF toxin-antitoxin module